MDGDGRRGAVVRLVGAAVVGCLAALLAVCGMIAFAATALDRTYEVHERELVERRLARSLERMVEDVISASVWNDAVVAVARDDRAWMQANFGDYYADYMGHDLTLLVDGQGRSVYASAASEPLPPDDAAPLAQTARELIAAARSTTPPHFGLEAARPRRAVLMIDGAPWLVVAAPLLAEDAAHVRAGDTGLVMVSARRVASLLPELQRDLGLVGARLSDGALRDGETAVELRSEGPVQALIAWTPARPGVRLLGDAAPYLGLALLTLIGALTTGGLKVRALLRQLAASECDLKSSLTEAERANAAKSQFLANMSHELRTPLNGVIAMAELLETRQADAESRDMIRTLVASGRMLKSVVDDVLDIARIEAGRVTMDQRPFDLAEISANVADLHAAAAAAKGVGLRRLPDARDGCWVIGDPDRVSQILSNLIGNAVKFTERGRVELRVRQDRRGVALVVADTGVGFEPAEADHLFRPFQQADASISRRFGGTGLGLAISRALVEAMGGRIAARSIPGRGAVFRVRLPLPAAAAPELAVAEAVPEPDVSGLRVLCVDDHPVNRRVVELILSTVGASVSMAEDGRQALDAFAAGRFDVVLMDLQMPVMDGLSATRAIRAAEAAEGLPRTPIIALTANGMPADIAASHAAGADCHLTKPISPPALLAALAAVQTPDVPATGEVAA